MLPNVAQFAGSKACAGIAGFQQLVGLLDQCSRSGCSKLSTSCPPSARELTRAVEYTLASLAKSMLDEHREEFASSEVASASLFF
jgi:hypothetical protein